MSFGTESKDGDVKYGSLVKIHKVRYIGCCAFSWDGFCKRTAIG